MFKRLYYWVFARWVYNPNIPPIWETLGKISQNVTDEEWERVRQLAREDTPEYSRGLMAECETRIVKLLEENARLNATIFEMHADAAAEEDET